MIRKFLIEFFLDKISKKKDQIIENYFFGSTGIWNLISLNKVVF